MAISHDERIQKLQKQLEQAKAAKRKADARKKAQESKKARAEDTRRKVLVGATVLALMDSNQWTGPNITEMLAKHLTRNSDRALFGLYPITEEVLVPPSGLQDAKT